MCRENTHDIGEVCRLLGVTSRTLRFYETRGIIGSTKLPFVARRQYTDSQIEQIKRVLVLRSLGISVKKIGEIQRGDSDLTAAVAERRAEIESSVTAKISELRLLEETLAKLEHDDDTIYSDDPAPETDGGESVRLADKYAVAVIDGAVAAPRGSCYAETITRSSFGEGVRA